MKFQQLPVGARFEYEGKIFVKSGPLTASTEPGGQRIIPRYAALKPLDLQIADPKSGRTRLLEEASVMAAFEAFYDVCGRLVNDGGSFELANARQKFLRALK